MIKPVSLSGKYIHLDPLSEAHAPGLALVGRDQEIWRYLPYGELTNEAKILAYIKTLLRWANQGTDLPFVVIENEINKPIGCTRYQDIQLEHKKLEIGGTWIGKAHQRTKANTESKYLLLKHAFEKMGCIRVQLKTDARNLRSQKAIERIGAKKEGVLRNHMILPNGEVRDSVFYSILEGEWPEVKQQLEEKLSQRY